MHEHPIEMFISVMAQIYSLQMASNSSDSTLLFLISMGKLIMVR